MKPLSIHDAGRVRMLRIGELRPNRAQPRLHFAAEPLDELAESIRQHGILQPLTVRRLPSGSEPPYELICGERRLRAARLAGLERVPCLVIEAGEERSSVLALVENIQRFDLDFVEQAKGIAALAEQGMTQEQIALALGKSQSAVANKLRILRHPPDLLTEMQAAGLTERHARALLRLTDEPLLRAAVRQVIDRGLNVAGTEALVERLLTPAEPSPRPLYIIKDVRLFLNTVRHAVSVMRDAGIAAEIGEERAGERLTLTVTIDHPSSKNNVF